MLIEISQMCAALYLKIKYKSADNNLAVVLLSAFLPLGRHPEVEAGQPWSSPRLPRPRLSIVQMAVEVQDPTKKNVKSTYLF